uniref:Centaurin-gamma-1A n=1 Tax=Panagrellus redivivus TaxID=6233 RepID=A0A7E4VV04_PANRE
MQDSREHGAGTLRLSQAPRHTIIYEQVRKEINRFESVHPYIYNLYDLIQNVQDEELQEQLRDQILNIENAFVNSQEWTLCRTINEIRLGVVGHINSGKTSLVHYYLTGAFSPEASPEGGRFKKAVIFNDRSHLMLIREEGRTPPTAEFSRWLDGVLVVFALDSRESFNLALDYYEMIQQFRPLNRVPVILVGTQDTVSSTTMPRVITEEEGRSAAMRFNMQNYFETNATYGLKVDEVFKEAYERILQLRGMNRTSERQFQEPQHLSDHRGSYHQRSMSTHLTHRDGMVDPRIAPLPPPKMISMYPPTGGGYSQLSTAAPTHSHNNLATTHSIPQNAYFRSSSSLHPLHPQIEHWNGNANDSFDGSIGASVSSTTSLQPSIGIASTSHLPTPTSTPTTQRKNRRISHLFRSGNKSNNNTNHPDGRASMSSECSVGPGRLIPIKQGTLYKRSSKALNKEWKKKYVCLHTDGRLTYHQNLRDYMAKTPGKEVYLGLATVRLSSRSRPKSKSKPPPPAVPTTTNGTTTTNGKENMNPPSDEPRNGMSTPGDATSGGSDDQAQFALLTSTSSSYVATPIQPGSSVATTNSTTTISSNSGNPATNSKKKRPGHRRLSNMGKDDELDTEFEIITNDQKRWEFSAASVEERDQWVAMIEHQIERTLQGQLSQKEMTNLTCCSSEEVQALRRISGNNVCADCNQPNPDWASLNLGTLICIMCSGIHRNLGSHISKVRSLELDSWPVEYVAVLRAVGNELANRIFEHNAPKDRKPQPNSPQDVKENWIKLKYEQKRFLPPIPVDRTLNAQLLDAVIQRNMASLLNVLPRCSEKDINACLRANDKRTILHLACSSGSVEVLQLLIWYNVDIYALDEKGHSALWHAEQSDAIDCRNLLLNAGLAENYGMDGSANVSQTGSTNAYPPSSSTSNESYYPKNYSKKAYSDWQPSALSDGLDERCHPTAYLSRPMPPPIPGHSRTTSHTDSLPSSAI